MRTSCEDCAINRREIKKGTQRTGVNDSCPHVVREAAHPHQQLEQRTHTNNSNNDTINNALVELNNLNSNNDTINNALVEPRTGTYRN